MMSILERRAKHQAKHFVVANFDAYQDGALTEADTVFYRQHLASCQECQDWESRQVRLIEGLGVELEPPSRLSPTAIERIYKNLYRRMKWRSFMNSIRTVAGTVVAIAIIGIAIGIFFWWQSDEMDEIVETTPLEGETPVAESVEQGELDEQLIEAVTAGDPTEVERLIEAIAARDTAAVEQLLKDGANPDAIDSSGDPILKSAIDLRNIDMVELLVEYGADVNALDGGGNPLLPQATHAGQLELVQLLLDAGADVHSTMSLPMRYSWAWNLTAAPALLHAVDRNRISIVELLISYGADVNETSSRGITSLHIAALYNNVKIIKILLDNGADPNLHDDVTGRPPLQYANDNGSAEAAQALVDGGADVDDRDDQGRTPMMTLLLEGGRAKVAEIVSILLDGGADPNAQDNSGNTALHYAARWGKVEVIPLLLEYGVDLDMENNVGKTALDIAAPIEKRIAEMLRDAGAEDRQ